MNSDTKEKDYRSKGLKHNCSSKRKRKRITAQRTHM